MFSFAFVSWPDKQLHFEPVVFAMFVGFLALAVAATLGKADRNVVSSVPHNG
jgi:hypothetical protein